METLSTLLANDRINRTEAVKKPIVNILTGNTTELLPPGSGVVIVANSESILFDELDEALKSENTEQINKIVNENKRSVSGLAKVSAREALTASVNAPVQIDLNYDTKTIAVNLFTVKSVELTRALFAFSGGEFDVDKFRYTEFSKSETSGTKVMVVIHQPTLSKRELQAVNIPKERSVMHFGSVGEYPGPENTPRRKVTALITVVTGSAALATAAGDCISYFDKIGAVIYPDSQIEHGKLLSVKELVRARQKAIQSKKLIR